MSPALHRVGVLLAATVVAGCSAAGLSACGGSSDYRLSLDLDNAGGLRSGSLVQVGGVPVGKVTALEVRDDDRVRATLQIDADRGPIGRDARASIASRNLLGEKYVNLKVGDRRLPLPSGSRLPAARVRQSVDLDQILDVLAPDTRAKVSVLIDEVGAGLTGQGANLNSLLRQFPPSLDKATELLDQVVGDNRTLGKVIERSDRFIAELARQRSELGHLVDTAGRASESFAGKRAQLLQTLDRAPATLVELRNVLDEVRGAAPPLGVAARAITASAPTLTQTLDQVEPFRRAAVPAVDQLRAAAPTIARLGREATPVVKRAQGTLTSLAGFSGSLAPVSRTLDVMIDDLMAALHGWSRAIQARDGISHMFRAKVAINPESLNSIITRLTGPKDKTKAKRAPKAKAPAGKRDPAEVLPAPTPKPADPGKPAAPLPSAIDKVGGPVGGAVDELLDFLIGP